MRLVEFVPPVPHPLWRLCPQMGITDVVVKVNPELTGLADPWRFETLSAIVSRLAEAGLRVVGLEGDPFDMSPIKEHGANGVFSAETQKGREEALAHYRELLESMGRLGIKLLCYNFMAGKGWSRTGVREGRGGAKATYFSLKENVSHRDAETRSSEAALGVNRGQNLCDSVSLCEKLILTADQVWANYEHFIKSVMPTAEKCGVRMSLHPDDPCLPSLGGYARIFGSVEAYDRAYAMYPSTSNDLEATARHFGKRIAFIHARDVEGTKEDFTELFHDQGDVDQLALMRVYRELGLDVPLRGDHVPEMAYDRELTPEGTPGYFTLGRLFANGYLKALIKSAAEAR